MSNRRRGVAVSVLGGVVIGATAGSIGRDVVEVVVFVALWGAIDTAESVLRGR